MSDHNEPKRSEVVDGFSDTHGKNNTNSPSEPDPGAKKAAKKPLSPDQYEKAKEQARKPKAPGSKNQR